MIEDLMIRAARLYFFGKGVMHCGILRPMRFAFFLMALVFCLSPLLAQQGPINLTAKSANVGESGIPVKINILRWSTDEERNPVVAALNPSAQPPAQAAAGAARGGRGAGGLDPNDPALADLVQAGRGGQGGRGGRGGGRGGRGDGEPGKPVDPITTLTAALGKAPTVGYLWTKEVVGYSIKYAHRIPLPNGGERIILATDRRLGADTSAWKPVASGTPTNYEFTLIEVRIDSKGLGEGKTSLTSKVIFDNEAKTIALDNYAAAPAILQNVKR
jgi:hypothetical protein